MKTNKYSLLIFILFLLLGLRFVFYYRLRPHLKDHMPLQLSVRLLDEPQIQKSLQHFSIEPFRGQKIYVTTATQQHLQYGDQLLIYGKLQEKQIGNPAHTLWTLSFPQITVDTRHQSLLFTFATFVRTSVSSLYDEVLPPSFSALLMGIVFGIKRPMSPELQAALQSGGVVHVISASGMNVSMVAGALIFLLSIFYTRKITILLSIIFIIIYIIIAGGEPSLLRAGIMAGLVFGATLWGRQYTALYALLLTIYLMLFWNPSFLTDVGFQLSVGATAGILLIKPFFQHFPSWTGDMTATLSAQSATVPILLATFGQFNLFSVVVNALVLWTVPPLMILGATGALVNFLFPPAAHLIILLSYPFLWYFQKMVVFCSSFALPLQVPAFPLLLSLGYYLILGGVLIHFYQRKKKKHAVGIRNNE